MVAGSAQCAIMGLPAAGAKFLKRHLFLVIVLCSAFSAQTAEAADGNPGGQGGALVPEKSRSGPGLTKIFEAGVEFLAAGDCKRAEKKFKRVLKTVPRNSEANYLRGVSLQCQNRHKQAVRYFKRSKRDDAGYHRAYAELGLSYLVLERPDLARKQLETLEQRKSICGNRCPLDLKKAYAKLRSAFDRIEGKLPQNPASDDQHGLLFDSVRETQ